MTKTKSYDKKIFRLWSILNKLDTGGRVYTAKLAKDFNVSMRYSPIFEPVVKMENDV